MNEIQNEIKFIMTENAASEDNNMLGSLASDTDVYAGAKFNFSQMMQTENGSTQAETTLKL